MAEDKQRPGMYALLIWIVFVLGLMSVVWGPAIWEMREAVKHIEAMQPCAQEKK